MVGTTRLVQCTHLGAGCGGVELDAAQTVIGGVVLHTAWLLAAAALVGSLASSQTCGLTHSYARAQVLTQQHSRIVH